MGLFSHLQRSGLSGFSSATTAEKVTDGLDLSGKTYIVTGSNNGLGKETVRVLGLRGARVLGLARTVDKAQQGFSGMVGDFVPLECELSDVQSIQTAIATIRALGADLSGVIANAGIMALPQLTQKYGYELQFFTNHVGHFILINGLLRQLTDDGRIVMLSSAAHEMTYPEGVQFDNLSGREGYSPWKSYGQSKLCNLLFAKHLATRLPVGQTANAVHPGVIATPLMRHMNPVITAAGRLVSPIFMKTVSQGAATQVYAATHPSLGHMNGRYFADCNQKQSSEFSRDKVLGTKLWETTQELAASLS